MDPFNHVIWIGATSVHSFTVLVLLFSAILDFYWFKFSPWGLVHAGALTMFSIHFYESLHGLFEYVFMGFLSSSVYLMNIPFSMFGVVLLNMIHKTRPDGYYRLIFSFAILSTFLYLGWSGFYEGYGKTVWWAISKVWVSVWALTCYGGYKNVG